MYDRFICNISRVTHTFSEGRLLRLISEPLSRSNIDFIGPRFLTLNIALIIALIKMCLEIHSRLTDGQICYSCAYGIVFGQEYENSCPAAIRAG